MSIVVYKLTNFLLFNIFHFSLIIFPGCLKYIFYLCNRNSWKIFSEKEETSKKQSKSTQVETYFPNSWAVVVTPATWQIIPV